MEIVIILTVSLKWFTISETVCFKIKKIINFTSYDKFTVGVIFSTILCLFIEDPKTERSRFILL